MIDERGYAVATRLAEVRLPSSSPVRRAVRHGDDDLALGMTRFELGHRIGDALKGVHAVENHFDRTVFNEAGECGQVLTAADA